MQMKRLDAYLHSYLFHKSTHSNGSGQNAFEHGLFDAQYLSMFLAITACPHCVPLECGGSGKLLPSNLLGNREEDSEVKAFTNTGHYART